MNENEINEGKWDYTEDSDSEQQTHDYDPEELERARIRMNAEIKSPEPHEYQKGAEKDIGWTNAQVTDQAREIMAEEEDRKSVV